MRMICATDLKAKSEAAVDRAGLIADRLGADLTLLHVVAPGESQRALEQTLQTALAHLEARAQPPLWLARRRPGIAVRTGNPARIVLDTVARSRARLLVLGPHRKRPLRDVLEGTIAEKAIAARNCAVLVVQDEAHVPYRRVLLALDLTETAPTAIRAAESLVLAPGVDARVLHVHAADARTADDRDSEGPALHWRDAAKSAVRDMLKRESAHPARYVVDVEQPPAPAAILRAINRYEPDLLVIGTRGGGRFRQAMVGSVANRVLHATPCDVLIVPQGSFGLSRGGIAVPERRAARTGARTSHGGERPAARKTA